MLNPPANAFTARVMLMRDAGAVRRTHTCRTSIDRNVAEHSHGVAMLVLLMYQRLGMEAAPGNILAAALVHDLSELATGDIPAPAKRLNPELRNAANKITTEWEEEHGLQFSMTEEQHYLLLWCDRMEFALYALEEVTGGNRRFEEYLFRILGWLSLMDKPMLGGAYLPCAEELFDGVCVATMELTGIDRHQFKERITL